MGAPLLGFLLSPRGRANRISYATFVFLFGLILLGASQIQPDRPTIPFLILGVGVWPFIAVSIKRCHDRNRSESFLLLVAIPFAPFVLWGMFEVLAPLNVGWHFRPENRAAVIILSTAVAISSILQFWIYGELLLMRGTRGDNRFGSEPVASRVQVA